MNQQELKEYSLYLEDNNFFSNIFIESNEIKSFIFERYAKGSCWWMRKADLGLLKFQKSIKEKYAGNLSILTNEIIGVYEEKFRDKKLIFLYSDQIFVNDTGRVAVNEIDIQDGNLYCQGEQIDICLSEPAIHFIEDLKKLESYEWENAYSHPVTRLSYDSRNHYMKLLLLICVWNHGISVDQIIFLSEIQRIKQETMLDIMLYSGYTLEHLKQMIPDSMKFFENIDIFVDGEYIQEKNENEMYRGSSNQKIYFFTDRYKAWQEKIMQSKSRNFSFEVKENGEVLFVGIPPKGFYEKFLEKIGGYNDERKKSI